MKTHEAMNAHSRIGGTLVRAIGKPADMVTFTERGIMEYQPEAPMPYLCRHEELSAFFERAFWIIVRLLVCWTAVQDGHIRQSGNPAIRQFDDR